MRELWDRPRLCVETALSLYAPCSMLGNVVITRSNEQRHRVFSMYREGWPMCHTLRYQSLTLFCCVKNRQLEGYSTYLSCQWHQADGLNLNYLIKWLWGFAWWEFWRLTPFSSSCFYKELVCGSFRLVHVVVWRMISCINISIVNLSMGDQLLEAYWKGWDGRNSEW